MRTAWLINLFLVFVAVYASAQGSDKLKSDQEKLEQKISTTKRLLAKSQANTQSSLNDLKLIENQITYREQLLKNYDNQIRSAELKVEEKQEQIGGLNEKIAGLKDQYKKLLLYAYKNRNKYGQMMFIFSADSYYEALKRNKYLKRIRDIQENQLILISQHQELIAEEIASIDAEKEKKRVVIEEKKQERKEIETDRIRQQAIYQKFKEEEGKLLAQLKKDEHDKAILKERINAAIRKEIAEAEAARKKKEAAAKKATEVKTTDTKTTVATKEEAKSVVFVETAESTSLSKSFEGNRGRLPWPVEKGTITENFGKNAHPTLKNVYTDNRGIDISAPKNAQVRAVFEGEVTSVLNIPGAGKVIIVKHGNYRTVYSNLQDTYVKAGDKVSTKKVIGSLLVKDKESVSMAHFEIHQVSGSNVICLNPSLWIAR
jgi:septal ring factor EnvC (AmiA/AmiB activator)